VPTRSPVLILTFGAAVPSGLALRANLELLQKAQNLAPLVAAILSTLHRHDTKQVELGNWIIPPPFCNQCNTPVMTSVGTS
jgi:hypothetical protein